VIVDGKVYVIGSAGILVCGDAETGEELWKRRLAGQFWATPVVAEKQLVAINSEGLAFVVDLADEGKILSKNDFKTAVLGSPAVANNALFVRGHNKLWKIAVRGVAARDIKKAPQ
jgi:outer membrane protein assembly factor BamB